MEPNKQIKLKRSSWTILGEVIAAVALCFLLLGGRNWSPAAWAAFMIVAAWIIIMNVRREAGLESEKNYLKWKQHLGLLMVIALLISPIWIDSWWPFIIGMILGLVWIDDYRSLKALLQHDSESSSID